MMKLSILAAAINMKGDFHSGHQIEHEMIKSASSCENRDAD